jgi:hypothetical protein
MMIPTTYYTFGQTQNNTVLEPSQAGGLKVLSSNSFIDAAGYLHLVGEIENGTPDPVAFVQASATFYDKNNSVVGRGFGYTNPPDLGPGDKAPFEIILTSASVPINQIADHNIIVSHNGSGSSSSTSNSNSDYRVYSGGPFSEQKCREEPELLAKYCWK